MLTIRLTRKGKKNQPFFRVVVIDKRRSSKGGRAVEVVGYVDPLTKKKSLKKDRILHWIKNGAQPSDTIHNLLIQEKIIEGKKIPVAKIKKSAEVVAPTTQAAAPVEKPAEAKEKESSVEATKDKAPKVEPSDSGTATPDKEKTA